MDFPFKNDETALRHMEHAELIAIGTANGGSFHSQFTGVTQVLTLRRPALDHKARQACIQVRLRAARTRSVTCSSYMVSLQLTAV